MPLETASIGGISDLNGGECCSRDEREIPSGSSTLNNAVKRIPSFSCVLSQRTIRIEGRLIGRDEGAGIEVEGLLVALAVGSKQAQAETKIERQALRDAPVILKIRFHDLIPVVVFGLQVPLIVAGIISHQHIGKCVCYP